MVRFGRHLIRSMDIDPVYPVLVKLHDQMDTEESYWHSLLYVGWYHLPVAHSAWLRWPRPRDKRMYTNRKWMEQASKWPTGIERRSNRGGKVFQHLEAFCKATDHVSLEQWFRTGMVKAPTLAKRHQNWRVLNERLQAIWGNGRWAAYKHCEILRRVHGLPVEAPDMGHRHSSGPREGLETLYGPLEGQGEAVIAVLDARGRDLQKRLKEAGLRADIEELETILCNWKSLLKGKYYVGHDIDEMQEQLVQAEERGILTPDFAMDIWNARALALPAHYLGELGQPGWCGVQKSRQKRFLERKIVIRKPSAA